MLLTTQDALKELGLTNPRILKWLNDRMLLPRVVLGPRTFRYEKEDCEALIQRAKTQGICLTLRPKKK